jgi:hypothetical protein
MTKSIPFLILVIFSLTAVIYAIYYFYFRSKKIVNNFNSLTEKYGFKVDFSNKYNSIIHPVAIGMYRNQNIKIGSESKEVNGKRCSFSYIEIQCDNPANISFFVQKRTRSNKVIMTREEVLTEEKDFDLKFVVQSNNNDIVKSILDYTNRYKLLQALNLGLHGVLKLNRKTLYFEEPGLINDKIALMRTEILIHCMCDMAFDIAKEKSSSADLIQNTILPF